LNRPPAEGSPGPDFTLASTAGPPVTLSAFRGRQPVLLAFFPAAFTSTCRAEMCEFSEDFDRYQERGVAVLPISTDLIPALRAWKAQEQLGVELLSDVRREASEAYGVLDEPRYQSRRAYFLVDREGIVRWAHVEASGGDKRDTGEIIAQIEALA
jgi:peroxiredoxin